MEHESTTIKKALRSLKRLKGSKPYNKMTNTLMGCSSHAMLIAVRYNFKILRAAQDLLIEEEGICKYSDDEIVIKSMKYGQIKKAMLRRNCAFKLREKIKQIREGSNL